MNTIQINQLKAQDAMSVLLVEDKLNNRSKLKQPLLDLNYCIREQINNRCKIAEKCAQYHPDILIISTDTLTTDILKELTVIDQLSPLPVLILATQDTASLSQKSMQAGRCAYIVDKIQPHRLNGLITVACQRFKARQTLREDLEQAKTQLISRKLVERAKGFIMQQKKITEQEAFSILRKMAMNNGHSLATVSKNVIEVYQLLNPSINPSAV